MDPVWLFRNVRAALAHRHHAADALKRLLWVYSGTGAWTIGFRYPAPIGVVRFTVRANGGSDNFIHGEVFEHRYYDLPLRTAPKTVLDLGAYIGFTAVYFARVFPDAEVACIEPVPANVRLLERNLSANGVDAHVFAAAVDVADGMTRMELLDKDYGHRVAGNGAAETIACESVSVPTIMRRLGWVRIGLLKVDIEGHEKVLFSRGCDWLCLVDAMCIECHEGFGVDHLRAVAERYGFTPPVQLPGIWLLQRDASFAGPTRSSSLHAG